MTLYFPVKQTTLLIPSGPRAAFGDKHLFVVLTNPCKDKRVLYVSITTVRDKVFHDPACELFPDDHDFIRQKSYVYYRTAEIVSGDGLVRGVRDGKLIAKDSVSEVIFSRICQGLQVSRFTPQVALAYYEINKGR